MAERVKPPVLIVGGEPEILFSLKRLLSSELDVLLESLDQAILPADTRKAG